MDGSQSIDSHFSLFTNHQFALSSYSPIAWQALTGAEWSPQNPMPKKPTMTIWAPRNPGSMEGITEYQNITKKAANCSMYSIPCTQKKERYWFDAYADWRVTLASWSTLTCIYWHGIHSPISWQNTIRLLRALGKEKRKCRIAKIYWHDSHVTVQLMLFAAKCLKFLPSCLEMRAFKSFTMQEVRFTSSMESISNGCLSIVASGSSEIQSGTKGCDDCEGKHHMVAQMERHRRGNIVSCCPVSNPLPRLLLQGFILGLLSMAWLRVSNFRYLVRFCHGDCYSSNTKARPSNSFDFSL